MRRAALGAGLLCVALGACAEGTPSADLFVVERSGQNPGANLTMLVTDGGFVRCNGGAEHMITSEQLIEARDIAHDLNDDDRQETEGLFKTVPSLPSRPGSQVRYVVRGEDGTARFADNSADAPEAYLKLQRLVRTLAKEACGLAR